MYLKIGVHPEAKNYHLVDLDKKEIIKHCIWADDEIGEYCVHATDEKGKFILCNKKNEYGFDPTKDTTTKKEIKGGNIRLIKMR